MNPAGWRGPAAPDVLEQLLDSPRPGDPRVFFGPAGEGYNKQDKREDCFTVTAQMMEEGEVDIVRELLVRVLGDMATAAAATAASGARL